MEDEEDPHYLKRVTSLGDRCKVVTNHDIYSKTGIKLAAIGSRINGSFYDRLARHKLMPPLDQCMMVENAVTVDFLLAQAKHIFASEARFSTMERRIDIESIWSAFSSINLNSPLAFKLTVAREMRPDLLDHSLRIALISLYLGLRCNLPEKALVEIATAAVFHDLGELHIDPDILEKKKDLTMLERRHIYAHPMVAYVILKDFPEYHPSISTTVLQHHECLDGSGYPAGVSDISIAAQILCMAEVASGIANRHKLEIVLKLNKHKLNTDLIGYLIELFRSEQSQNNPGKGIAEIDKKLAQLAKAFEEWDQIRKKGNPLFTFADQRIFELRQALFDAGFNPLELERLTLGIEDDPESMHDVHTLVNESFWQIKNLEREMNRLPDYDKATEVERIILKEWITRSCMEH